MSAMTLTAGLTHTGTDSMSRWLMMLAALGFSVMAVVVTPLVDHDVVRDKTAQESVDLGLPVSWVHQDQSALDPPLPAQASLASPWESPTSVSVGAFALDVVFVLVVAAGLGLIVLALRRLMGSAGPDEV